MQRSRRALLRRRALEKALNGLNSWYKISLSLVVAFWVLVFLLNLWIGHGDGHQGQSEVVSNGIRTWDEDKLRLDRGTLTTPINKESLLEIASEHPWSKYCPNEDQTGDSIRKMEVSDKNMLESEENEIVIPIAAEQENQPNEKKVVNSDESTKEERFLHFVPLGLDEYRSKAFSDRSRSVNGQAGNIIHRVEPGGTEYNYASSSKGAKVLAYNKEAKGASNILSRDKDKYLRSPCSTEEKFVVIELSEETLVDTVEIANFEHHSSNLKDFELRGSLVYPTDTWVELGNFTAGNVKQAQRFVLPEPKWVRYLKLNLLSHHGSEFYCTLSFVEVYGVDAVERMLEDLISVQNDFASQKPSSERKPIPSNPVFTNANACENFECEMETDIENSNGKQGSVTSDMPSSGDELRHQQVGRMPGDSVLKILMQKVRFLDLNLSVLERYLEKLNSRYGTIFQEFDKEMVEKGFLLDEMKSDIQILSESKDVVTKEVMKLLHWKYLCFPKLENIERDNAILRLEVQRVSKNLADVDNKGTAVFVASVIFGLLALIVMCIETMVYIYNSKHTKTFPMMGSSWFFLLFSYAIITIVLSL